MRIEEVPANMPEPPEPPAKLPEPPQPGKTLPTKKLLRTKKLLPDMEGLQEDMPETPERSAALPGLTLDLPE
jgi:hypothetical protein